MFSELIDRIVARTRRPSKVLDIIDHTHQTLNEIHSLRPWEKDLHIKTYPFAQASATEIIPRELNERSLVGIALGSPHNFLPMVKPNALAGQMHFGIISNVDGFHVFGLSGNVTLYKHFYKRNRRFNYYETNDRPAKYDRETGLWTYKAQNSEGDVVYSPSTGNLEQEENARELVGSWLLLDYPEVVMQGAIAKLRTSENDEGAGRAFQSYKEMRRETIERVENFDLSQNAS